MGIFFFKKKKFTSSIIPSTPMMLGILQLCILLNNSIPQDVTVSSNVVINLRDVIFIEQFSYIVVMPSFYNSFCVTRTNGKKFKF